jgi:aspartyl-tRNA(Asn)/glutamyl-tRNA(Gln) amidotransferase subunit A
MELIGLNVKKILDKYQSGEVTAVELCDFYLNRIEEINHIYNAYIFVRNRDQILEEARAADEMRQQGSTKKLLGVPFAIKDSFLARGTPTTAGDKYLEQTDSVYDATVVKKLLDEGAILLGKTNMDSWGFGGSTENSAYGVTKNPFDQTRVAGGSSGGSAAALALDMCAFAIGEDTGGSIRNPASFCGVYGLKPTYGRISRFGCIAYASSLDSVGPFAKTPEDIEILFPILEGGDGYDMTYVEYKNRRPLLKKFAFSLDLVPDGINENTRNLYLHTVQQFTDLGYEAIEVKFPVFDYTIPTYYITAMAEASTNLARYHGTRYGHLANKIKISNYDFASFGVNSWEDLFTKSRTEGFTNEAKKRVFLGAFILSEGYVDAYYKKAQIIRNYILHYLQDILTSVDFILSPVTPSSALKVGSTITNPLEMYLEDVYTVTANLAGIPALAFPAGKDENGMPIGMQIMGNKGDDENLISIIKNFHNRADDYKF